MLGVQDAQLMTGFFGGNFLNNQIWSMGQKVSYSKSNKGFRRGKRFFYEKKEEPDLNDLD